MAVLVVADEVYGASTAVSAREGGHAVVVAGDQALAGAEGVALAGQDLIAETFRQVEQAVRVGDQGAVPGVAEVTLRGCRAREEFGEGSGERDACAQGAGAGEGLTAGH